jgi:hypothetical protein
MNDTRDIRDPATRPEAEQVTAQGLTDAVGHAREIMQMRMLDAGADQLTDYTGSPQQAQALAGGSLDTATGACLDFRDSSFSPPGQPCTASFLACLACRNAVATRRHLPRLAWLHRALDELRGTVDAAGWAQDWRTHFLRLTALLADNTTLAEREAAARSASDADRELMRTAGLPSVAVRVSKERWRHKDQSVVVIAISPSASRRRVAASWLRAVSGIASGSLPPLAARSAAPLMYLAARRSSAGGNKICAGLAACFGAASAVICPSPDSVCA